MTQMAMTQNFVWITTDDTDSDFIEYKQFKEEKTIKAEKLERFDYTLFKGYHWFTLACRTKVVYDLYRVYDKWQLVLESEDPVIELPMEPKDLVIKAYDRYWDNKLIQLAESREQLDIKREKSDSYKLSVVVPCYNSDLFVCRTVDSIMSSSLSDIELILVNDGSKDNTLEICKRYEDNYSCVRVIDQENGWQAVARNNWMDIAKWDYLAFCDSDDIAHPYMYEILYQTCIDKWLDIAISSTLIRTHTNQKEWYINLDEDLVYTFEEMMEKKTDKDNIYFVAVWNKIVKTEIARKTRFPEWYRGKPFPYEDIAYTWALYSYMDKFAYCHEAIYIWDKRKRDTVWTISTTWTKDKHRDYVWEWFIYAWMRPLYNKSWKHLERHDYIHFNFIAKEYVKFGNPSAIKQHFEIELRNVIISQNLKNNKLIMADRYLADLVNKLG